ncbi:two-component system response regulator KdpE [Roseateles aquatilis]|uniref:Two-component system response regulator KdpE n=1 Tax=Roseateles aquatilis TaxID=431061 RepID=A0A246JKQ8_9BURK|nr:response regulator [Roseateles aquatilis]OWQ93120.1 two-component system response regulator KdpE [Roseateles aquatilis]
MSARQVHTLVVEDDPAIRQMLVTALQADGHQVHEAESVARAETLAGNRRIDLFLVDLGLPDRDGLVFIRQLRQWTQRPIIVLSARSQEEDKVEALDCGADDYLTKPFGVAELRARLRVALRRAAQSFQDGRTLLRLGDVSIDMERQTVLRGAESIPLTATQWRVLSILAKNANRVVSARHLLREVWGPHQDEHANYLRVYVHQLRRRLEVNAASPRYLLTETGVGYRLLVDD